MNYRKMSNSIIEFKKSHCNENFLVSNIIKENIHQYFINPILDIGAGMGDILINSFPDKKVTLLDKINFSKYSIPLSYKRITEDFFNCKDNLYNYNTVFISHALQFLDEDIVNLNIRLNFLNIKYLIIVLNKNDDLIGEIIKMLNNKKLPINPEIEHNNFPAENFNLIEQVDFSADLSCNSFDILSDQVFYLMDYEPNIKIKNELIKFLKTKLQSPQFKINQKIQIFKNNNFIPK